MACAQAKIPCVWHLQDIVDPRAGLRLFRPLLDFGARMWATRVVCISRAVAAQLGRAAQSRVSIIYNGVDPDLFTPDGPAPYRERWLGKHFEMVVGQVGRFTPWKGQEDVLALARRAREAGLPIRFVLVGDDSFGYPGFGQVLAHRIAREHLEAQVLMAGWLEDLPNVYRSLDLLVHPLHLPEPFGLVLAEAMGCARPVALFPRGGAGEVVDSTEVGLRLPPGNLDALWRAIVWVYENRAAAQAMGARGRRHVIEHFSFEQFANQFLELYDALAPTPAAAASRAPQT
jgi:glycosyltransferase involved in cell wall biosynthesis